MSVYKTVQPKVIDGEFLLEWMRDQPGLEDFEIVPQKPWDCTGESRYMAEVDIEDNDPTITTDPASLAAKDIKEYQRGDYHHVYVQDVLEFAYKSGIITDTYVLVIHKW